jgi:hypothetical protein
MLLKILLESDGIDFQRVAFLSQSKSATGVTSRNPRCHLWWSRVLLACDNKLFPLRLVRTVDLIRDK